MSLATGLRLAQYEIVAPIASGGMGEVYRARDSRLGSRRRDQGDGGARRGRCDTPQALRVGGARRGGALAPEHPLDLRARCGQRPVLRGDGAARWGDAPSAVECRSAAVARGGRHRRGHRRWARRRARQRGHPSRPEARERIPDPRRRSEDSRFRACAQRMPIGSIDRTLPAIAHTEAGVVLGTFGYMSPEQVLGQPVEDAATSSRWGACSTKCSAVAACSTASPRRRCSRTCCATACRTSRLRPNRSRRARTHRRAIDHSRPCATLRVCTGPRDGAPRAAHGLGVGLSVRGISRAKGKSLAVLPFLNPGGNQQIEYLTDGITESIINALSQVSGCASCPAA